MRNLTLSQGEDVIQTKARVVAKETDWQLSVRSQINTLKGTTVNPLQISSVFLGCCMLASIAKAQVPTESIKQGTILDASGIQLSFFGSPMPLPPGKWEVVQRVDSEVKLKGEGPSAAPKVSLTVRNTDVTAPLAAMVIGYTPEVIQIRWNGNAKCEDSKANLVEDFGTTTGSLTYACSISYANKEGFKAFVANAPAHANAWVKANLSPLVPYLADIPDRNIWSSLQVNRDRGRSLEIAFIARSNTATSTGKPLDSATSAWIKSTGKAYIDFLESNASTVQPMPASTKATAE
jgi:hypothetical protein